MHNGPVQLLVIGFDGDTDTDEILTEMRRLKEHDFVRVVDMLFVTKDEDGTVTAVERSDLSPEERMELGGIAEALIGLGATGEEGMRAGALAGMEETALDGLLFDEGDAWYATEAIPPGTSAVVTLIEHRWAIPLRDVIARTGGFTVTDAWVHPADLVAVGMAMSAGETS